MAQLPEPLSVVDVGNLRRLIVFLLGIAVVLDALIQEGDHLGELVCGLVLLGLVPVDALLERMPRAEKH